MRFILTCSIIILSISAGFSQQRSTTVILVRHAEKAFDESGDPDLTEAGKKRAMELVRVLKDQRVDAIYTTPFKRTLQTIEPLAADKDITIEEYNPFKLEETMEVIRTSTGRVLVFSGHSNTVPVMLNQMLGADNYKMLDEKTYDNLFIVTFEDVGKAEVVQLKFGLPSE